MFTGFFKTTMERCENVIINVSATIFIIMLFLKLLHVQDITWYHVAAPIVIPVVSVIGLILIVKLLVKFGLLIYNLGEKLHAAIDGIFK